MTTWFCDAYASWQKGGVENANGRLRRWLPRQIDVDKLSDQEIQDIVITANLGVEEFHTKWARDEASRRPVIKCRRSGRSSIILSRAATSF